MSKILPEPSEHMPIERHIRLRSEQQYPIYISNQLEEIFTMARPGASNRAFLIIDEHVHHYHFSYISSVLGTYHPEIHTFVVPSGETSKSVQRWAELMDGILLAGARRATPVYAAGGGVTGDLAGFVAASVLRGLPLYHIPTTVLAMVDSSIGGKTGVNHSAGKNLIGAFYQPKAVLMATKFLSTLPEKEWKCGLGEVLKYACIQNPDIADRVRALFQHGIPQISDELAALIETCASVKAKIVEEDEKEKGNRAFLNFGHTFAHALEAYTNYTFYAHGEAVYIGMIAALHVSQKLGYQADPEMMLSFRNLFDLRPPSESPDYDRLVSFMHADKKNTSDRITLVLLEAPGKPILSDAADKQLLSEAFAFAFDHITIA